MQSIDCTDHMANRGRENAANIVSHTIDASASSASALSSRPVQALAVVG